MTAGTAQSSAKSFLYSIKAAAYTCENYVHDASTGVLLLVIKRKRFVIKHVYLTYIMGYKRNSRIDKKRHVRDENNKGPSIGRSLYQ